MSVVEFGEIVAAGIAVFAGTRFLREGVDPAGTDVTEGVSTGAGDPGLSVGAVARLPESLPEFLPETLPEVLLEPLPEVLPVSGRLKPRPGAPLRSATKSACADWGAARLFSVAG
ncbi:MAG: hypothetical protein ACXWP6_15300 [Ktedonobacterales bacterium]